MNVPLETAIVPGNWSKRVPGRAPGTLYQGNDSVEFSTTAPTWLEPVSSGPPPALV